MSWMRILQILSTMKATPDLEWVAEQGAGVCCAHRVFEIGEDDLHPLLVVPQEDGPDGASLEKSGRRAGTFPTRKQWR